jgi:hypothetical protein
MAVGRTGETREGDGGRWHMEVLSLQFHKGQMCSTQVSNIISKQAINSSYSHYVTELKCSY